MATVWSKDDIPTYITPETVRYELQRFNAEIWFSQEVLHSIRISHVMREVTQDVAFKIVGMVATWREERLLKVPANWWQHVKQRFFPHWALKRWPVLYQVYDAAVILPRVPVVRPEYHTVEFPVWQAKR